MVFDVRGRLVKHILDGQASPGRHYLTWHGQDERGEQTAPGIYIIRMTAGHTTHIRKAVLLR
jgi:flagellar hook assembly protein FlgD